MGGLSGEFILGCIISFAGTTVGNYGMNLMKYASFKKARQLAQLGCFREGVLSLLLLDSGEWVQRYFSVNATYLRYVEPTSPLRSSKQEIRKLRLNPLMRVYPKLNDRQWSFDIVDNK